MLDILPAPKPTLHLHCGLHDFYSLGYTWVWLVGGTGRRAGRSSRKVVPLLLLSPPPYMWFSGSCASLLKDSFCWVGQSFHDSSLSLQPWEW